MDRCSDKEIAAYSLQMRPLRRVLGSSAEIDYDRTYFDGDPDLVRKGAEAMVVRFFDSRESLS
ncbi:MAG: hypothetical protein JWL77_1078 [Chthonomonadaceae bacterium]|nr:hypothetical protein [Chthonomonadaceae bacterium]